MSGFEIGENVSSREAVISFSIVSTELSLPFTSVEMEARRAGGVLSRSLDLVTIDSLIPSMKAAPEREEGEGEDGA